MCKYITIQLVHYLKIAKQKIELSSSKIKRYVVDTSYNIPYNKRFITIL